MANENFEFKEGLWCSLEDNTLIVGVTETALNEIEMVNYIELANEGDNVENEDIVGKVMSVEDSITIYSPVSGVISEVNEDLINNPQLIYEDPLGESWLFKIEAEDSDELETLFEEKKLVET